MSQNVTLCRTLVTQCLTVRYFFVRGIFIDAGVCFYFQDFKERFVQCFFHAEKNTVVFAAACDGLCGLYKITLGDWDGVESVYTFLGDWGVSCPSSLYFSLLRQRKVTKERRPFGKSLRVPKG